VSQQLRLKTRVLTVLVILSNVFGNFLMSWGMKHRPGVFGTSALDYIRVLIDPAVTGGVLLLIFWLLSRMTLLSWADLSYVLPVTSIGYVLTALLGHFALGEQISGRRWIGTLLIMGGTALVGSTAVNTRSASEAETPVLEEVR
jgi:uncharacterized membrane protein